VVAAITEKKRSRDALRQDDFMCLRDSVAPGGSPDCIRGPWIAFVTNIAQTNLQGFSKGVEVGAKAVALVSP